MFVEFARLLVYLMQRCVALRVVEIDVEICEFMQHLP